MFRKETKKKSAAPIVESAGVNQTGLRAHNERLVLTLLRRIGPMAKTDIAGLTGLSLQAVSVIMRALEADGLLVKGEPVRGKVGQPSVPLGLAPEGAYFLGFKLGRRSSEVILVNFIGDIIDQRRLTYRYPVPEVALKFVVDSCEDLAKRLPEERRDRIEGLGVAMPFQLWDWPNSMDAKPSELDVWRSFDLVSEIQARTNHNVFVQKDATAACGAEVVFGANPPAPDYLYVYVGFFVGGAIVLNNAVFPGARGNAGAIGSMLVPTLAGMNGASNNGDATMSGLVEPSQLINTPSLSRLETLLTENGRESGFLWDAPDSWNVPEDIMAEWIDDAAKALAISILSSTAIMDFGAAVIDGWIPTDVRRLLVERVNAEIRDLDARGVDAPDVVEGHVGPRARSLGAASLPLAKRYMVESAAYRRFQV